MALKRGGFIKRKQKSLEQKEQARIEGEKMWALFEEVFKERGPYSEIDGTYLGSELRSWMVDHLLPKSRFKHLKYEKDNLFLVTFEQHQLKESGYPLPLHKEAIERARQKFNIL
jgi:hypothetical protein